MEQNDKAVFLASRFSTILLTAREKQLVLLNMILRTVCFDGTVRALEERSLVCVDHPREKQSMVAW